MVIMYHQYIQLFFFINMNAGHIHTNKVMTCIIYAFMGIEILDLIVNLGTEHYFS